ncbi:MAG: beta-ketoacyl synthase N-terminal-like domain-containing protein [Reinekea sp.]
MATPIGLNAREIYYTARAGVSRFRESRFHDKNTELIVTATVPHDCLSWNKYTDEIVPFAGSTGRLSSLYRLACADLALSLDPIIREQAFPLFLGIPERMFNRADVAQLCRTTQGLVLDEQSIRFFAYGRAASLIALHEAMKSLKSGQIKAAYVAGCDSYTDPGTLFNLDRSARLKSATNLDGFIPGEGAGVLLLTTEDQARQQNWPIYARLTASHKGFEDGFFGSDAPYKGEGLAKCIRELLTETPPKQKVAHIYSSMNGERYWAKEWGVTHIRNKENFESDFNMHHPAECFGDTGAACGVLLTALAALAHHERHINSEALVYASADEGERCAVLVA